MTPISKVQAQQQIGPYHDRIAEAVYSAWDKLVQEVLALFPGATVRFKRNAMYELMIQKARPLFEDVDGLKLIETKRGRILLIVKSAANPLILRFKKVNNKFETSNYPTQESLAYDNQMPYLPGIPPGARITVGYVMNEQETELRSVHIICSKGNIVYWDYPLSREGATVEVVPATPFLPALPSPPERRVRAKTKVTDIEAARKGKNKK